jgi:ubiquinone/menaquinone biosynthesis C-methylase UbiE
MTGTPDFSGVAKSYSAARPGYPAELFAWLASVVVKREVAWDAATGSGQAAVRLADHFARVVASDRSRAQLLHARDRARVAYRVALSEESGLPASSVDLVAVAAALHWFDRPRFYDEVRRVTRGGGVLAAWTYHVAHVEPPFDEILGPFYRDVVGPYFASGARLVDDRYETLALPGRALETPSLVVSARWTVAQVLDFVRTWSGVQSFAQATGVDPVAALAPRLASLPGAPESVHEIRWPLYLRASRLS